jgi:hypothetical protein
MKDDRRILARVIAPPRRQPTMRWRGIIAALALEAFGILLVIGLFWFLAFGVVTK